ncbi:MAG: hypothetical protein MJ240_01375 [Kiritimatiellae bacterium]|nr:hypothetical protein [Kiritimatiellia bacterium]
MRKGLLFGAVFAACLGVSAAEDPLNASAVTNVTAFLVQVTNQTSFALLPATNLVRLLEAPVATNVVDLQVGGSNVVVTVPPAEVSNLVQKAAHDAVAAAIASANAVAEKAVAAERLRRIDTRTFKLKHASAEAVAEKFNNTWSGDFGLPFKLGTIAQAFPEVNTVMVTAPGVILDACAKVIEDVDVEPRQVYIEARFVELQNSAVHKLGIDWSMLDGVRGSTSFGAGIDRRNIGNAVQNYTRTVSSSGDTVTYGLAGSTEAKKSSKTTVTSKEGTTTTDSSSSESVVSGRDGGVDYFTGTLSFSDMYLVLSALDSSGDAKVFSNPKIIVASGKKATVDMTEKYPNVTIASKRTLNGNSESLDLDMKMAEIPGSDKLMFAKEAFFSWGISLEVTPRVTADGLINVSIVPTISEKSGEVTASSGSTEGSKYPIISVQRLVTDFALSAGTTAVIGGLSKTTEEQVDTGIPWLRDWPWIGDKLFGSKSRMKIQKEILVFVTVGLADPKNIPMDVGLPKNAVLGRMYTEGQKIEPGDRAGNAIEGIASLDYRDLEEQARDPLATNRVESIRLPIPFPRPNTPSNQTSSETSK